MEQEERRGLDRLGTEIRITRWCDSLPKCTTICVDDCSKRKPTSAFRGRGFDITQHNTHLEVKPRWTQKGEEKKIKLTLNYRV